MKKGFNCMLKKILDQVYKITNLSLKSNSNNCLAPISFKCQLMKLIFKKHKMFKKLHYHLKRKNKSYKETVVKFYFALHEEQTLPLFHSASEKAQAQCKKLLTLAQRETCEIAAEKQRVQNTQAPASKMKQKRKTQHFYFIKAKLIHALSASDLFRPN